MRGLWAPNREGIMSPGERFLVYGGLYGISALAMFFAAIDPDIVMALFFALLGFVAEWRWNWRVLLAVVVAASHTALGTVHAVLPEVAVAWMLFPFVYGVLWLLLIAYADPLHGYGAGICPHRLGLRELRGVRPIIFGQPFLLEYCGLVSNTAAMTIPIISILIVSRPDYLDPVQELTKAFQLLIVSALLFSFVFGVSWVRAMRKAWAAPTAQHAREAEKSVETAQTAKEIATLPTLEHDAARHAEESRCTKTEALAKTPGSKNIADLETEPTPAAEMPEQETAAKAQMEELHSGGISRRGVLTAAIIVVGTSLIWRSRTAVPALDQSIRTFMGHTGNVYSVAISPDGRTALSGSFDDTLKLGHCHRQGASHLYGTCQCCNLGCLFP